MPWRAAPTQTRRSAPRHGSEWNQADPAPTFDPSRSQCYLLAGLIQRFDLGTRARSRPSHPQRSGVQRRIALNIPTVAVSLALEISVKALESPRGCPPKGDLRSDKSYLSRRQKRRAARRRRRDDAARARRSRVGWPGVGERRAAGAVSCAARLPGADRGEDLDAAVGRRDVVAATRRPSAGARLRARHAVELRRRAG